MPIKSKWRRIDVDATPVRRIDVNAMSIQRHISAGHYLALVIVNFGLTLSLQLHSPSADLSL